MPLKKSAKKKLNAAIDKKKKRVQFFQYDVPAAPLTNSPIRLSDVEFNTNEFERSHGRQPRGRGGWGFVAYEFSRANNYLDHVKWFNGTYQDAKRQARAAFAAEGVMEVVVCS